MSSNFDFCIRNMKFNFYVILLFSEVLIEISECITQEDIDKHLQLGKQYLANGHLGDALTQYHLAVEGDPNNYLTYFKRGTVYLALGKAKNALSDLDRVLEIKPDFTAARISRGNIHLKQAHFDLAQLDFYNVLKADPYNAEANSLIQKIDPVKERKRNAEFHYGRGDFTSAIHYISEVIEVCPWAPELYDFRSELYMMSGDEISAISDLKSAAKLQSDDTDGYYKLSQLLYKVGQATEALKSVRECLKLDPEHKDCFPFYKKVKKIEKLLVDAENAMESNDYTRCIEAANKILTNEKENPNIIFESKKLLCTCYSNDEQSSEAIKMCTEALNYNEDPNIYCDRAEAYLQAELYDDAIRDYRSALEINSHLDRAKEGLNKAEKRQKQAEQRDYYKILEVKRTASKKEIVKAYRKMAQKWHPDNYQNDEKMKKIAEKKFIDIAAAKEVLTDEEKRKQFDNGEDPLDPESGRGGMPNFHHFQSFHGSPFQFKFHFN
ncbi:dnaJ homolog subfamily C member P58IPK [Leptinotarsa decemlineata]|uniref:dnaJ homolog subfamily C member P58IPK n=1 Tax=Leptinotarsa decemlineata TaxID=7539 RepID=UPI003D307FE3